jgi:hypothetical protein
MHNEDILISRRDQLLAERKELTRQIKNTNNLIRRLRLSKRQKRNPFGTNPEAVATTIREEFRKKHPEVTPEIFEEMKKCFPTDASGRINTREALRDYQILFGLSSRPKSISRDIAEYLIAYYNKTGLYSRSSK